MLTINTFAHINKSRIISFSGFSDNGEMWREPYESDSFIQDIEALWKQVQPLYKLLHAYVRSKLVQKYGPELVKPDGPIPAHLLGMQGHNAFTMCKCLLSGFRFQRCVEALFIMHN